MCREGCPIHTPIPDMIQMFLNGKLDEAGQMLFDNNPLSVVCSLVCDHEKQCEGHCVRGIKGEPVHISSIENYISDSYLDRVQIERASRKNKRVAIIGSGPAGITISVLMAQKGYDVTLFESRDKIGGVRRYGIPDFRLPKTILDRYKTQLVQLGIKIRPNTVIGSTLTLDDLQRDGYKAIFIGTGVWRTFPARAWAMYISPSTICRTRTSTTWATTWWSSVRATRPWMWPVPPCAKGSGM